MNSINNLNKVEEEQSNINRNSDFNNQSDIDRNSNFNNNNLFGGNYGWICPKCRRVFSPFTHMCPYCIDKIGLDPIFYNNITSTLDEVIINSYEKDNRKR